MDPSGYQKQVTADCDWDFDEEPVGFATLIYNHMN